VGLRVILEYRCDFCEQTAQKIFRKDRLEPVLLDASGNYPTGWTRRDEEFVCPLHRIVVRDLQATHGPDEPPAA